MPYAIEAIADISAEENEGAKAVRLYGAASAHRQALALLFSPPEQLTYTKALERMHKLVAPAQFEEEWEKGQSLGLLPDQVPPLGMGLWVPFFGQEAYTMTLSVRLAQQTGATVLMAWGERLSWGRGYRVHFQPLSAPLPQDGTQAVCAINREMEALIRGCPQQYLWGYARYKQPRQEA